MAPYQCPCCDFFTLRTRGEYEICPLCRWEDDGSDLDRPEEVSSPNRLTLREARHTFRQYEACDLARLPRALPRVEWHHYERQERILLKRRRR